jgi:hypothetical protein
MDVSHGTVDPYDIPNEIMMSPANALWLLVYFFFLCVCV